MKRIEFTAPKGFVPPEGKAAGDKFEAMATFQVKSGNRMCLVAIGDVKMPGYEEKASYTEPSHVDVATRYHEAMA